jgi:hypothetical protein
MGAPTPKKVKDIIAILIYDKSRANANLAAIICDSPVYSSQGCNLSAPTIRKIWREYGLYYGGRGGNNNPTGYTGRRKKR